MFTGLRTALFMMGFILLWGWLALLVRRCDSRLGLAIPHFMRVVGLGAMVAGGILALLVGFLFSACGQGTPAPFDPPRKFVVTGPFRYVRNPMYLGGLLLLIGFGFYQLSVSILFLALFFALLAHVFVVLVEEPHLERRFGESYLEYIRTVNRWLPGLEERDVNRQ